MNIDQIRQNIEAGVYDTDAVLSVTVERIEQRMNAEQAQLIVAAFDPQGEWDKANVGDRFE